MHVCACALFLFFFGADVVRCLFSSHANAVLSVVPLRTDQQKRIADKKEEKKGTVERHNNNNNTKGKEKGEREGKKSEGTKTEGRAERK